LANLGRQSPIKRERGDFDDLDGPLPKMMRNMPGQFPNFNPANIPGLPGMPTNRSTTSSPPVSLHDPKHLTSSPLSAAAVLNAQKEQAAAVAAAAIAEHAENAEIAENASEKRSISTPAGASAANTNAQSIAAAAALGRLFPGASANMGGKINVNGKCILSGRHFYYLRDFSYLRDYTVIRLKSQIKLVSH